MVWMAGKSMCSELAKELSSSKDDVPVREININTVSALYPQKRASSEEGWKKANAASGFSALSLSFAYELYKELNAPIGILLSAHSNTRIEAFTQRKAIEVHPKLSGDKDLIHDADPLTEQGRMAGAILRRSERVAGRCWSCSGGWRQDSPTPQASRNCRHVAHPSQFFNGKIAPSFRTLFAEQSGAREPATAATAGSTPPEWKRWYRAGVMPGACRKCLFISPRCNPTVLTRSRHRRLCRRSPGPAQVLRREPRERGHGCPVRY